jgi:hypothetical protein
MSRKSYPSDVTDDEGTSDTGRHSYFYPAMSTGCDGEDIEELQHAAHAHPIGRPAATLAAASKGEPTQGRDLARCYSFGVAEGTRTVGGAGLAAPPGALPTAMRDNPFIFRVGGDGGGCCAIPCGRRGSRRSRRRGGKRGRG